MSSCLFSETQDYTHLLTHWGRVTHICVGNLTFIGPDNGLLPGRRQAIIWTSAGILLIGPWVTNFSEILIGIHTFSFKKIHLKMSSAKWRPFYLGLNVLTNCFQICKSSASIDAGSFLDLWKRVCKVKNFVHFALTTVFVLQMGYVCVFALCGYSAQDGLDNRITHNESNLSNPWMLNSLALW